MNSDQHREAMGRAESLMQAGDAAAARALYQKILEADPQFHPAYQSLALLAHGEGNLQLAADLFNRAIALDSTVVAYQRNLCEIYRRLGRFAEAVQAGTHACRLAPDDADAQFNLALARVDADTQQLAGLFATERHAEAAALAEDLTRRMPGHGAAWNALGAIHGKAGRHDAALQAFLKAAALMPGDAETWHNLGIAQRNSGQLSAAEASFRQALQLHPDYADAYQNLATLLKNAGRFDEAEGAFRMVLQLKPVAFEASYNLGNMLLGLGRREDAAASYRRALLARPDVAEVHNNLGVALRALGRVQEAEKHYRQAICIRDTYAEAHYNLGINLIEQRRFPEAETCTRRALQLQPDYAEAHSNMGVLLHEVGRLVDAETCYRRALALKPDYAQAHYNLGITLMDLDRTEEAEASYRKALALDPYDVEVHNNLGILRKEAGDLDGAAACYRHALALDPKSTKAYNNLGIVLAEQGQFDESEASLLNALAITGDYAEAHYNLGLTWLAAGKLERAWPKYEYRWEGGRPKQLRPASSLPQWTGQAVPTGARLLVFGEQGMGDKLQFARYLPLVQERFTGGVSVVADAALLALFRHTYPDIEFFESPPQDQQAWKFHCPMLSLPLAFNTSLVNIPATVPYLFADPLKVEGWKNRIDALHLAAAGKAGLVWKAGRLMKNASRRSLTLEQLSPLFQQADWQWFSLQKEADTESAAVLASGTLIDWSAEFHDFADTAALIANLDLVISVDTSVAHLAGAMGKPVWLLNRHVSEWRWMRGTEVSPWYPSMRIFTQARDGEWGEVVQRVADACATLSHAIVSD